MTISDSKRFTAHTLFEKLKNINVDNPLCNYTLDRCAHLVPFINEILTLKEQKNAIILAHSYVHPDIIYSIADHTGDSYGLSKEAKKASADTILFPAVRFMAETAKILNPTKTVIDPNPNGGCSLADSISQEQVLKLREKHPHHTFVCYINTTAAVKAACDVCVTSSNAYQIIEALPNDKIFFLPDKLMGLNIKNALQKKGVDKEILFHSGTCYVHEEFQNAQIDMIKHSYPSTLVIAHPECKPEVTNKADLISSTTGMIDFVKNNSTTKNRFLLLTECGIISRLQTECPEAQLIGTCTLCKFMKSNSLEMIKQALKSPTEDQIIDIDPVTLKQARKCIDAMFIYAP
jgi:quinolinate synthase